MGPLAGLRVIELAGIGPAPFCAMLLGDLGADVVRVDRPSSFGEAGSDEPPTEFLSRSRRSIAVDLKHADGLAVVLRLLEGADVLLEGFRPGVAERLGLGPAVCFKRNPRLVYGRMTGWGQEGPLAATAGHDIDYIAVSGALHPIGRGGEPPVPPLNLVGDFGGGALYLALGVLAALYERGRSGMGQVIDAAMVDGSASLTTMIHQFIASGIWGEERSENLLDTGAPFYDVYGTRDGEFMAVGALEPQFFAELLLGLEIAPASLPSQYDRSGWDEMRRIFTARFATKTRAEWEATFAGTDACVAPVQSLREAPHHPHNVARSTFVEVAGHLQPAPAPRFARTPATIPTPPPHPGEHTDQVLAEHGYDEAAIRALRASGAIR